MFDLVESQNGRFFRLLYFYTFFLQHRFLAVFANHHLNLGQNGFFGVLPSGPQVLLFGLFAALRSVLGPFLAQRVGGIS